MNTVPEHLLNTITTGDARLLSAALPDESVDLVFCDPVYWNIGDYSWVAQESARVLKTGGHLLVWQGVKWMPETMAVLGEYLTYRWTFTLTHLNAMVGTIKGDVYSHWTPCFWYSKGLGKPNKRIRDVKDVPLLSGAAENHAWHKSLSALAYWLGAFSESNAIILDPFTGGGTVPAVCKMLGRQYVAFEIDPDTAERARLRVQQTQPPLPFVFEEQSEMELA